jgi:hypothetical protein
MEAFHGPQGSLGFVERMYATRIPGVPVRQNLRSRRRSRVATLTATANGVEPVNPIHNFRIAHPVRRQDGIHEAFCNLA